MHLLLWHFHSYKKFLHRLNLNRLCRIRQHLHHHFTSNNICIKQPLYHFVKSLNSASFFLDSSLILNFFCYKISNQKCLESNSANEPSNGHSGLLSRCLCLFVSIFLELFWYWNLHLKLTIMLCN